MNKEKKKNIKPSPYLVKTNPNQGVLSVGSDESDTLILSLTGSSESWVMNRVPPFIPFSITKSFKII